MTKPSKLLSVSELSELVQVLSVAKQADFIKLEHAKAIFTQALDFAELNTPKPEPKSKVEVSSQATSGEEK